METLKRNQVAVDALVRQLYGSPESVVPVVGAGMSVPTGCPTWEGFLSKTIEQAHDAGRLRKDKYEDLKKRLLEKREYVQVADELWSGCELLVNDALQAQFRVDPRSIQGPIRLVPKLCWRLAITTNYDRILEAVWEAALAKEGAAETVDRLFPDDEDELDRAIAGTGKVVLKLHGDVENPGSWVMKSDTYAKHYDRPGRCREFLVKLWSGKFPLFLGNSLVENPLIETLHEANRTGYAVMPLSSREDQERLIKEHGDVLKFIWLRPEDAGAAGDIFSPLDPFLDLVARRARLGAATEHRPRVFLAAPGRFDGLETAGRYQEIVDRIRRDSARNGLVESILTILHYCDLGGLPEEGLTELAKVRRQLDRHALSPEQRHALDYLTGRLLAQKGEFSNAISTHRSNLRPRGIGDYFQIQSRFELGQLYFRAEEFGTARDFFADLHAVIDPFRDLIMIAVDVLKFLASLEVVKLLHDPPGHEAVGEALLSVEPTRCLALAKKALLLAEKVDYRDGIAWAHAVTAFGLEAEGGDSEAEAAYTTALEVLSGGGCRISSRLHVLRYKAGFHRRAGDLEAATRAVRTAFFTLPDLALVKYQGRLHEEAFLIALAKGDEVEAGEHLRMALEAYAHDPMVQAWNSSMLAQRLRVVKERFRDLVEGEGAE